MRLVSYIDAGTGSAILALLAGGFSGAWILIKNFFSSGFRFGRRRSDGLSSDRTDPEV